MSAGKVSYNGLTLEAFIDLNMPKNNPGDCVGQCAADIAAFIQNNFSDIFPVVQKTGFTLQRIDNCGANDVASAKSFVVFDNNVNSVTGWNHAGTASYAAPYDKLSLTSASDRALYNVPGVTDIDPTCNDSKTQSLVLIKKLADWDKQHSNGIEPSVAAAGRTFADADKIVIELKINSAKTKLQTKAQLKTIYGSTLTDTQYDELDMGKPTFGISLVNAKPAAEADMVEFQRFVEIDPAIWADKWMRITIPVEQMDMFTDVNWKRTPTTVTAQAATIVDRLRINPEIYGSRTTDPFKWGNVIRNLVGGPDDPTFAALKLPETFRELGITVKKIEIVWK